VSLAVETPSASKPTVNSTSNCSSLDVYDATGQLAAEYTTEAVPATGTEYLTDDHLGSTRLVTGPSGNVVRRYDFLPFGEDLTAGTDGRSATTYNSALPVGPTQDWVNNKFTGKLRDNESGLDFFGARYFSGAQGRFTSVDWSAKPQPVPYAVLSDPQTLNLYAYVRDNPLRSADPNGHENPSSYYGPLEDQVQNAPMSDTEKHVDAAILAGSSAFATGGLTLEAMAAGEIIASITGTMAAGASVVATGYETTAAIAHISSEQSEKVTTALGAMSTPAGILTTAVTRSPTLGRRRIRRPERSDGGRQAQRCSEGPRRHRNDDDGPHSGREEHVDISSSSTTAAFAAPAQDVRE
jgi:RHS repeat-associated protein